MNRTFLISLLIFMTCGFIACSEDDIKVDESLTESLYPLSPGEPGSVDELIYQFYERYGTCIYYKFEEQQIRYGWTSKYTGDVIPVKPGNEEYVRTMVTFLQENIFENYEDDFVRGALVYNIFLVDSCTRYSANGDYLDFIGDYDHKYIIANVGPQLDDWTDADWRALRDAVYEVFVTGFYNAASVKPSEFISLKEPGLTLPFDEKYEDPLSEYESMVYSFRLKGYMSPTYNTLTGLPTYLYPDEEEDFRAYLNTLTNSTKTELTNILTRFERVRERALVLVSYLKNILNLDVVATQNQNCPEDPIPENFFSQF